MRRSVLALLSVAALTGCSSFIDTTNQTVLVTTPGVVGAECILATKNNQYRAITPMKLQIQRSDDTMDVTCKKSLYYPAVTRVESRNYTGRSAILNSMNAFVGTGYDVASNAVYRYPDEIVVHMELDPYAVVSGTVREEVPEGLKKKETAFDLIPAAPEPQPAAETMTKALRK